MDVPPASQPRHEPGLAMPGWDGNVAGAQSLQREWARRVVVRDDFHEPLRTVAGLDVGLEDGGTVTRAAAVLLDAGTLEVIGEQVARAASAAPCPPDLRSFHDLPLLLQALEMLPQRPDLVLVQGHGIAHPRRLGLASHFGVVAGLASVGIAGSILVGTAAPLHDIRGAHTPLRDGGQQVGWLLRSRHGGEPLVVSPGHRVSMTAAAQLAMRFTTSDRVPEPIRLANRIASHLDGPRR
ncbi:endonuclease V [Luteimonas sp. 50]|uniref:Endonuclease V n=1 Tax=Cognatiluteimonas sedimenti TaxID=2927791 RepID=A0ABT0A517_9GAMM|nr:endonuclease V [Lysobacter sedimenti]MCJ0826083.1 endonuclease V [Lysobacter sedimenti]